MRGSEAAFPLLQRRMHHRHHCNKPAILFTGYRDREGAKKPGCRALRKKVQPFISIRTNLACQSPLWAPQVLSTIMPSLIYYFVYIMQHNLHIMQHNLLVDELLLSFDSSMKI